MENKTIKAMPIKTGTTTRDAVETAIDRSRRHSSVPWGEGENETEQITRWRECSPLDCDAHPATKIGFCK